MAERTPQPLVLIVDDDESTRWLASAALAVAGFATVEAVDGAEALALQLEHRPDALLLDISMPVLDGYEVCRRVRQGHHDAVTPIMVMTVMNDVEAIETAYAAGATDFLHKPLNLALLGYRMRYMLRAAAAIQEARGSASRLRRAQRLARLAHWQLIDGAFAWSCDPRTLFGEPAERAPSAPSATLASPAPAGLLPLVHPEDLARVAAALAAGAAHQLDYRIVLPSGEVRLVHQEAELDPLGPAGALFGATQDVTDMRLAERRIVRLAYFDEETGLPNREFLRAFLSRSCQDDEATSGPVAVISLELGVRKIKDALAMPVAQLIRAVIERVSSAVTEVVTGATMVRWEGQGVDPDAWDGEALVARVGDDELAIAARLDHLEAANLAEHLAVLFAIGFEVEDSEVMLAASVGLACHPHSVTRAEEVAQCAHAAMVCSRDLDRGSVAVFDLELAQRGHRRMEISRLLHRAIAGLGSSHHPSEFHLYYQPKIDPGSGELAGVEALLRWRPPGHPQVSPDQFIPIAEATGVIVPLGAWVLREACEQGARWARQGTPVRVAVNISARQLREPMFAATVIRAMAEAGFSPALLELELTEHVTMHDFDHAVAVLRELRDLGVKIALDDFGIGYSSLSYLSRLPIDTLKIDRSFILQIGQVTAAEAIPVAIIAMARSLGLRVVAEGVETAAQAEFLDREGACELQGFLFARPMPASELEALLGRTKRWSFRAVSASGPIKRLGPARDLAAD